MSPGARVRVANRRDGGWWWRLPVGWDRDGAVANAYAVAVCPAITLARRGGTVVRTLLGSQTEEQLRSAIGEL